MSERTNDREPHERVRDYDDILWTAARLVYDGTMGISEVELSEPLRDDPDIPVETDDEFRDDVREKLKEAADHDPTTTTRDNSPAGDKASEVNWPALWDEFGFGTPDAVGSTLASRTQLRLAIECSEQGLAVSPVAVIQDAVDEGVLEPVRAPAGRLIDEYEHEPDTGLVVRGYRLGGDA